jgi:hypothetical protein
MSLSKMEEAGELEPLASSAQEITNLLEGARRWLDDAEVAEVSNPGRYESAYNAILNCALAALRANDYRVDVHEAKHVVTLNTLQYTLGIEPDHLQILQKMRQRRNIDLYTGGRPVSEHERKWAVATARTLLEQTVLYVNQLRSGLTK